MKCVFSIMILVFITILTGCSTTKPFNKIPTDLSSFRQPESELIQQYPEIKKYEKTFRGFHPNFPLAQDLVNAWGEPDDKTKTFGYPVIGGSVLAGCGVLFGPIPALAAGAITVAIRPYVPEIYYWKKGNYCIEVSLDKTINNSYKKTISYWHWYNINSEDKIPDECKKIGITSTSGRAKLLK